jgi:hypothetical protein
VAAVVYLAAVLLFMVSMPIEASTVLGPWVPIFKGIDHAEGTNMPPGQFQNQQVVEALRVDLTDPDIQLFPAPRNPSYSVENHETAGYTTTNFLKNHNLQVAINANYFHDPGTSDTESPSYTLPQGTPFDIIGVLISQGQVVSPQEGSVYPAAFFFATNNQPTFIPTNWPAQPTAGVYNAVCGLYAVLVNGVNIGSNYIGSPDFVHGVNPRTAFGLSKDHRYLYVLTIDGRQAGYSDGAYDWETAGWLQLAGAWEGANMDGGGSTCMAMMDSTRNPVEVNHDSAAAAYNVERTVGCHLGFFAQPVPGFINDVTPMPDDTTATITWTTIAPSTSQIQYGLTPDLGSSTMLSTALVTNHAVLLTNLTAGTGYYFNAVSTVNGSQYVSSNYFFVTTNYVVSTSIFDLTNTWSYDTANLDAINWTAPIYNDSGWDGSGPGLLWIDIRGPNPNIPAPLNTQMPGDPNNAYSAGYPYITYYFRTHFTFTNSLSGVSLLFSDYIDDGAVFYLNGTEIYRLRMPPAPTPIYNATLAAGYACSGDATCPDSFTITGALTTNLVVGDNVLAAEVHNYSVGSPDITFGTALSFTEPYTLSPQLNICYSNSVAVLSWNRGGFTLQQAATPLGPWANAPGPIIASPYNPQITGPALYYRLIK